MGNGTVFLGIPGDNKQAVSEAFYFYTLKCAEDDVNEDQKTFTSSQTSTEEAQGTPPSKTQKNFASVQKQTVWWWWWIWHLQWRWWGRWVWDRLLDYMLPYLWCGYQYLGTILFNWAQQACHDLLLSWRWTLGPCPVHGSGRRTLIQLSEGSNKYYCNEHVKIARALQTPKRVQSLKSLHWDPSTKGFWENYYSCQKSFLRGCLISSMKAFQIQVHQNFKLILKNRNNDKIYLRIFVYWRHLMFSFSYMSKVLGESGYNAILNRVIVFRPMQDL